MKQYLSFGGGVNSVALFLYLVDQREDFEALFVDHGTDWPETYEYLEMFQGWLKEKGVPLITVLTPKLGNLYDYCLNHATTPSMRFRWCTDKFKLRPIYSYVTRPCFQLIGIDASEAKRAKLSVHKGVENRFPLIEAGINRTGCKKIIEAKGLPVPRKSGCYICPYQGTGEWKELRRSHPELFCNALRLEDACVSYRNRVNKQPIFLSGKGKHLRDIVDENQLTIFKRDKYPPCNCAL